MNRPRLPQAPRRRRWWQNWFFKIVFLLILLTIGSIASFYVVESELGEFAWNAYQKEAASRGTKLRLEDYTTPPIPDHENYAAAPIFQKLFASDKTGEELEARFKLPELPKNTANSAPEPKPFDLTSWQQAFVKAGWIPSAGPDPASDTLLALERMEKELSEIREASARPKCRWPVKWGTGLDVTTPPYGRLAKVGQVFTLRSRALLATNRPDEALGELEHIFRLEQSLSGEPTLIPGIVRLALSLRAADVMAEGIAENKWQPHHLETIERLVKRLDTLAVWRSALDSERGLLNRFFEVIVTSDRSEFAKTISNLSAGPSTSEFSTAHALLFAIPRGWIRYNHVECNQLIDIEIDDIDSIKGKAGKYLGRAQGILEERDQSRGRLYYAFTTIMISPMESVAHRALETYSRVQQLQILFALKRYQAAHGALPDSLDQLVPEHLSTIPRDAMDGKAMRYRRTEGGGCVVWSIAKNRIDDGGTKGIKRSSDSKPLDWLVELPALHAP